MNYLWNDKNIFLSFNFLFFREFFGYKKLKRKKLVARTNIYKKNINPIFWWSARHYLFLFLLPTRHLIRRKKSLKSEMKQKKKHN